MSEWDKKIYSRRYPQAQEIMGLVNKPQTKEEREAAKQSLNGPADERMMPLR